MDKLVMMTNHCDIIMQDLVVRINKSMTNYSFNVPRQFLRVCGRIANSSPRILPEAGDLLWRVGQHHLKVGGAGNLFIFVPHVWQQGCVPGWICAIITLRAGAGRAP